MQEALGRHIIVEFFNCEASLLNDVVYVEKSMEKAATKAGATLINSTFHHFSPYGVSGVVVIQESHLAIHTWPEWGFASVDLFTCGQEVDPWAAFDCLKKCFKAEQESAVQMFRGQLNMLKHTDFYPEASKEQALQNRRRFTDYILTKDIWFTERSESLALSVKHHGKLLKKESKFQRIEIFDTIEWGKMLALDGTIMCAEQDTNAYHEMLVHVPLFTSGNAEKVLIIGGGDGGAAKEVLKHKKIKKLTLVEIDQEVVKASKDHLSYFKEMEGEERLEIIYADGTEYIQTTKEKFDVIIVDSADPVGFNKNLFGESFYQNVYQKLADEGLFVVQSESPMFNKQVFMQINEVFQKIFGKEAVWPYLFHYPCYASGMWSMVLGAKGKQHPLKNFKEEEYKSNTSIFQYYNEEVHRAAFALPEFVKRLLQF